MTRIEARFRRIGRAIKAQFLLFLLIFTMAGCAVHYSDPETGVQHIWGFGHMKMKVLVPAEGLQAIVHGTDTFGITLGSVPQQTYVAAGWHSLQFIDVAKKDTSIRLEFPDRSFFGVCVGSKFPLPNDGSDCETKTAEPKNDPAKGGKESP